MERKESSSAGSPYRMGNWTVTMLKEELRSKQLPVYGKKAELIDRLENSPVKTSIASNSAARSPLKSVSLTNTESPKSLASNFIRESSPTRGRSRSQSPSHHRMLTRSRSTSLIRGTFLTWSRQPFSVLSNFFLAQIDSIKENFMFFGALSAFVSALFTLFYVNAHYRKIFFDQLERAKPIVQVFLDGFTASLGYSRSDFTAYISKAARFMYDCSSGNIERNASTGRLRCSAAPLKLFDFGLPGRLFWLTREQFFAWTFGTLAASTLIFFLARKSRTALPLETNAKLRKFLNFSAKLVYPAAIFLPYETSGLISGFSGFSGKQFFYLLMVKLFLGIPFQFTNSILIAKFQKYFTNLHFFSFSFPSAFPLFQTHLLWARQAVNSALYVIICAAAVQVIANARLHNKNHRINLRR